MGTAEAALSSVADPAPGRESQWDALLATAQMHAQQRELAPTVTALQALPLAQLNPAQTNEVQAIRNQLRRFAAGIYENQLGLLLAAFERKDLPAIHAALQELTPAAYLLDKSAVIERYRQKFLSMGGGAQ